MPIETWCYSSPGLRFVGKRIDIGLLAEALIYYDQVLVNVANEEQFADLLNWFIERGKFNEFVALLNSGILKIYDYSFATAATLVVEKGSYIVINIQDPIQAEPNTFRRRYLRHNSIKSTLKSNSSWVRLNNALRDNVIEVKAEEFGNPNENAEQDFGNGDRLSIVLQSFVEELYAFKKLGRPPTIDVSVERTETNGQFRVTWNIDLDMLKELAGKGLNFHQGTPLTASAHSNRLLWSASSMNCDLYLGQPISMLVGDKLYEGDSRLAAPHSIIDTLQESVEFPDLRQLVNKGEIDISEILRIRGKAGRFRQWLQDESDRDRDALIAYHNEVAKESGYLKVGRKAVKLFGVQGGGATGAALGAIAGGPAGAALGGAAGGGLGFVSELASRLKSDWRPVVFGKWYKDRIDHILKKNA